MAALVHIAGLIIAQQIANGRYPSAFAIPLGLLISRLRTPPLIVAVFSCVLHEMARQADNRTRRTSRRRR